MAKRVLAVDADRIRRLGRSWSSLAQRADGQRGLLTRVRMPSEISTTEGDRLRSYVGALGTASVTMSAAYTRAAANAPRVAAAIEAATAAEHAVDRAEARALDAEGAVSSAETAVVAANVIVATHRAAGAISILIGMTIGPSPAQFAALAQAEHLLIQAAHKRDAARWVLRNAERALTQAEQGRHRLARAFAAACRTEAEVARRALPRRPRWPLDSVEIGAVADRLAALASVAAGQACAIERFAQGDAGAAKGALQIVGRSATRLEWFGHAAEFAGPVIEAAEEAFAAPDAREPSGEMRQAGAP